MIDRGNVRLSNTCIRLLAAIGKAASESVLEKAIDRAVHDQRSLIDENDLLACVRDALGDVAEQLQGDNAHHVAS